MSIRTGPCDWPLLGECPELDQLDEGPDATPIRDAVVATATAHLWNWTSRVFGLCSVTVRPCRRDCGGRSTYDGLSGTGGATLGPWSPCLVDGQWRNVYCGTCGSACDCGRPATLVLPGPVDSVTEVRIDGTVLVEANYRVDNNKLLVRTDGNSWPQCQDLAKPTTEENTWSVTYDMGIPVPEGGQLAGGLLACQMAKAVLGKKDCELPTRVQTITREGVTVGAVLDTFEDLQAGKTGVWLVDSWVSSVTKPKSRSGVYLPGRRSGMRRTTYQGGA